MSGRMTDLYSRMNVKGVITAVLFFAFCSSLWTLGIQEPVPEHSSPTELQSSGIEYPLTIEDDYGNLKGKENHRLVFEKPVERMIVGEKGCALVLLKLGVIDRVIAAGEWVVNGIPGYEDVPSIGGNFVDVELILGLNPDVLITLLRHNSQSTDQLVRAGVPVYTVGSVRNLEHIKEHIYEYGLMLDRQDAAQQIIDEMNAQEAKAAELAAGKGLPEEARPRVFMFGPMSDIQTLQTWVPGGETIVEDIIRKAGGRCLAAEQGLTGWTQYSLEKLLESDPDVIILPFSESEFSSVEEFTSMDLVKNLKAVKNNRVYGIDSFLIWDLSYKNAQALLKFAEFINQ